MAIDKSLYSAPEGLEDESTEEVDLEMEMELSPAEGDAVIVELDDGGVEITMGPANELVDALMGLPFDANLAEHIDETVLNDLAGDLLDDVESDIRSRKEWTDSYVEGLDVLGFKYEERTRPWENACGVFSTVLAEAIIRFQADTMAEVFPAAGPVRTKILGETTREKEEAAERVKADMNYQLTEEMQEYRPEHERLLFTLGLAGSAFKKVYFDPGKDRQVAVYIPGEDVIVPYGASTIETAERVTHVMRKTPNELRRLQLSGFYVDTDIGEPAPYSSDIEEKKAEDSGITLNEDNRHTFYEIHAELSIPGVDEEDDIAKPYVITVDHSSGIVLSIYRNWEEGDALYRKRQHFVHYVYVPGFGFYGLGLLHIIGGYAKAGTSIIRQLVDAGTLSNLPGGLKSRGMRIKGDDTPIEPGEWRDVDVPSGTVKENILPLPYKEPSQTLLALLDRITEEGRRLGAIGDMNVSDMSANAPVGTTLALIERALKPMTAVQARVHYAMKQEFKLLKAIIADHAPDNYDYQPTRGAVTARKADYMMVDVIPVSDPNSSTMAQRVVQYQTVLQMSQTAPQIYDLPQLHRQMLEVIGIKNAEKIIPIDEDARPTDPISENMAALIGKPMKAFIYQDHDAHIAAHQSLIQDPQVAATIGQSPRAQEIMASLQAHIAEHLAFSYRRQIEEKLGAPLPPPNQELPEEIEVNLSRLVADASAQLTQAKQQQAAQQQAQQQAQDPIMQLRQMDAQTKQAEVQRKTQKDAMEFQLKQMEQERKRVKDEIDARVKAKELSLQEAEMEMERRNAELDREDQRTKELLSMLTGANQGGMNGQ
ncbi:MAG: hypothetical protein RLZZ602_1621 [Pseudomonadota bacterium]|jgi:hypothetical protein